MNDILGVVLRDINLPIFDMRSLWSITHTNALEWISHSQQKEIDCSVWIKGMAKKEWRCLEVRCLISVLLTTPATFLSFIYIYKQLCIYMFVRGDAILGFVSQVRKEATTSVCYEFMLCKHSALCWTRVYDRHRTCCIHEESYFTPRMIPPAPRRPPRHISPPWSSLSVGKGTRSSSGCAGISLQAL